MDYEDRLIIYIDVLGFTDFVNYTTISQVNTEIKINKINSFLKMINDFFKDKNDSLKLSHTKQVTAFSDLIIVSINVKEISNIDLEVMDVFYLLLNATYQGFLLRGSIVYGKLIHNSTVIFGSGLIDAYNREKKIAKYPRVILDSAIYKDLKEISHELRDVRIDDFITCDFDGIYYIDMFKNMREYTDSFWQYTKILSSYCGILIEIIENPLLKDKTEWMTLRFLNHVNDNSEILNYSFDNDKLTRFDLEVFQSYLSEFDSNEYKKKM